MSKGPAHSYFSFKNLFFDIFLKLFTECAGLVLLNIHIINIISYYL